MTHDPEPITDEQVDSYLDGLLKPEEREAFEVRLRAHPEIAQEIQLQTQVDASLGRLFPLEQATEQQLKEVLLRSSPETQASLSTRANGAQALPRRTLSGTMRIAIVGLAAALAWVIVGWQSGDHSTEAPYFQPKPVAVVYQEVLDNGFEPYYECREEDRFAATFLRRQGQALSLAALPLGSEMLGLSYAGGLSRDTTSMLCRVEGQPVMVFVDRLENDLPIATQNNANEIKIHRVVKYGLVFYEVTPFDTLRIVEYLVLKKVNSSSE